MTEDMRRIEFGILNWTHLQVVGDDGDDEVERDSQEECG